VTDWKVDRGPLVDMRAALANAVPGKAPATELLELPRLEPMNWGGPQREKIRQHVLKFKSHQQRLIREREEFATGTLKKMNRSPF
jgi:hypothetical protein